ncbi:MAG: hypothetical protein OEY05_00995 [Paracoccaceae bacterium]|nr:hypothetical protein [Paracoccaceae bacterium]
MELRYQQLLLKTGAAIVIGFGFLVALAAHPATQMPAIFLADVIFWPPDSAETGTAKETRLMAAVGGAVMAGWGWAMWTLAGEGLRQAPQLTRRIILGSVALWFVIDCLGSLAAGAALNVLGNVFFLPFFVLPFWRGVGPKTVSGG